MQQDYLRKSFGLVIAFVVPGMIGLYAASFLLPAIQNWFGTVSSQPPTVGGFLFINVAASGTGVFLSGARYFVIQKWLWRQEDPGSNVPLTGRSQSEAAYQNLVAQFYDFYLFYANTLVALIVLYGL